MASQQRPAAVSTVSEDLTVDGQPASSSVLIDDGNSLKGGPMDIEANNELGDFEGQQQDFNSGGLDSDIIGRQTSGFESYVTDNSTTPAERLIEEYQEYRSNGSEEEREVYVEPGLEEQADPAKREGGYARRSSYLQSITEEGTILSEHDLMQDPLGVRDKSHE